MGSSSIGAGWDLDEGLMPESELHRYIVDLLRSILQVWATREWYVGCNLAVRWERSRPQIGLDPDVCLISPPPVGARERRITSLRTWLPGNPTPALAFEIVSESNSNKDYAKAPAKYAACGVDELLIFDPLRCGPAANGGPFLLQHWQRAADGSFARSHAGEGPAWSRILGAWISPVDDALRIANDEAGIDRWPTREELDDAEKRAERAAKEAERAAKEAERAAKEAERAAKEAERAAKEAALARVAELEAELAKR